MSRFSKIALLFLCAAAGLAFSEETTPPESKPPKKQAADAAPVEPLLLEIQQVEEVKRGMNSKREILFTLQTLVQPGSPVRLRTVQKGQAVHLEGSLGPKEADGFPLKLQGSAIENIENMEEKGNLPPELKGSGPVFDSKEFKFEGKAALDKPVLIGEVADANKVYRLATFATLRAPGKPTDLVEEIRKHRK